MFKNMPTTSKKDAITIDTTETLREAANAAGATVREAVEDIGKTASGFYDAASNEIVYVKDSVTDQIRSKPVQSTFTALGIGFLLGFLFRR